MSTDAAGTGSARSTYDVLWARFLDGTYTAGDRLPEAAIAEELGVSRTPVREALSRMLAEGLLTPAARGVVVAGLDHDAKRRLFDLRRNLEGFAAELTAARARDGQIAPVWFARLNDAATGFAKAIESGEIRESTRINRQFHDLIVEASGNEFLADAHRRAIARLAVSTAANLGKDDWAHKAAEQHVEIARAIADGDVASARALSEAHISDAQKVADLAA
ncbi:GntR family transcriptional regulator [Paenarthrobacter aromaticivorans]|uniref:GntR family transcriptional regulator n=1 Tax=Paenarthrobacter aromaticivorans TaxID=2849150 RepID=A0ABS6I1W3_9MICC|nr:GntR family transcriptional regulator [Paenarthrobacter sp. MMS21-TAE1-1]MBU8864773.1 GntR family transcriptional regulator [Paenarthrobacter sp. MMS21-TAE1-1]